MAATRMDITSRPVELSALLDGISQGTVALPDFQRDFTWSNGEVASLVATLLCGWPAGSLLLMKGRPSFFNIREFESAPKLAGDVEYVVLDGQQRLSGLYNVLRNSGPYVYLLYYRQLIGNSNSFGAEALEEIIRAIKRSEWDLQWDLERQIAEGVMPLYVLSSAPDYFYWRDEIVRHTTEDQRGRVGDDLSEIYRVVLGTINHYDFPAIVLENQLPVEAIARIFERINSTGVELTTFDLMVARTYTPQWNLRSQWELARQEFATFDSLLGDDGLPILQAIALHDVEDVRKPAVLSLGRDRVREAWPTAVEAMNRAIAVCHDLGSVDSSWLPYRSMLITLAGVGWDRPLANGDDRCTIERWYWSAALAETYDVGSSTRIVADRRLLEEALSDGGGSYREVQLDREDLLEATRRRDPALWRTFMALLSSRGAVDPFDVAPMFDRARDAYATVAISLFNTLRSGDAYHLRVLGLVRVSRGTASRLRRASFAELLREASSGSSMSERLESQFLPKAEQLVELLSDPEQLLLFRTEAIREYLESRCGLRLELRDDAPS